MAEVVLEIELFGKRDLSDVPFKFQIANKGLFFWSEEVEEKVDIFLNINAPASLLSYIRPLITQFTSFSNFPPLILPLIDFTETHKND